MTTPHPDRDLNPPPGGVPGAGPIDHQPAGYDDDGAPFDCLVCGRPWPCPDRPTVARGEGHGIARMDGRPTLTLTDTPDGPLIDRDTIHPTEAFTLDALDAASPPWVQGGLILRDHTGLTLVYATERTNPEVPVIRGHLIWRSDQPGQIWLPNVGLPNPLDG